MIKRVIVFTVAAALLISACGVNEKSAAPEISGNAAISELPSLSAIPAAQDETRGFAPPEMTDEQAQYNRDCVMPLLLSGLLTNSWSTQDYSALVGQNAKMIYAFDDITGSDEMKKLYQTYDGSFPSEVIESLLLERFAFTADQLREMMAEQYRADENIYYYEGGRGGGPVDCAVTGVRTEGSQTLIDYCWLTGWAGYELDGKEVELYSVQVTGVLTVTRNVDGGFRYQSVEVSGREEI